MSKHALASIIQALGYDPAGPWSTLGIAEAAATVRRRRDELEAEQGAWRAALKTSAQQCETCEGTGVMNGIVAYDHEGDEKTEPMPCAECHGTGKGALVKAAFDIVARGEREACAKLCERLCRFSDAPPDPVQVGDACATAIRCRETTRAGRGGTA